ncbi:MAG: hypothetical protein IT165_06620 [Bryobacterales bacterium]|nr:hypothetical protein [Bryobacterales bacterium]
MRCKVHVVLVCESGGKTIPLARVADDALVDTVARTAIAAATARADEISKADVVLGALERAEARRLSDVLTELLPGITAAHVM